MSACLLGQEVRYDGKAKTLTEEIVTLWLDEGRVVSVCPEVQAGMSIPRSPAEIIAGDGKAVLQRKADVVDKDGERVTDYFVRGANIALELCRRLDVKVAVLTESSPSCGSSSVYDGTFTGEKISGAGVTTALLRENGIQVFSQHEIEEADKVIRGTHL